MCGIAGILSSDKISVDTFKLKGMMDSIKHRGPDDAGYLLANYCKDKSIKNFTDKEFSFISPELPLIDCEDSQKLLNSQDWNLFLGHRRLSIIDLSSSGHQPMKSASSNVWLIYNGEIYNFKELRSELKKLGYTFNSNTDSEVIIQSYVEWGESCLNKFNGMFSFAILDFSNNNLFIARDRYGIKPLYYYKTDEIFVFASEVKSILSYLNDKPRVDLLALNEYFSFQNIFSDRTLFSNIKLLPQGSFIKINLSNNDFNISKYWDFSFTDTDQRSESAISDDLYDLLKQAVKRQCVADVPIGSYLSGGMDSGTVTSLSAANLGRICTFTGGFDLSEAAEHEVQFDERETAEKMASIFQTEHYECVLHAGDIQAIMDQLIWHLEDLRVGQSYPNFSIARLASKFVKVVMSGAGGDELFGGYPWRYAAAIGPAHSDYIQNYYRYWKRLISNKDKKSFFTKNTINMLSDLNHNGTVPFKDHTISVFKSVFPEDIKIESLNDQVRSSLYFECKTFLHGLLLVEDKLSMAHSLETRIPFLDNDLVDFSSNIPVSLKVKGLDHLKIIDENLPLKKKIAGCHFEKYGKSILRTTMKRILPDKITQAKKQGFSAPDESWFKGLAEKWMRHNLISGNPLYDSIIEKKYVNKIINSHCKSEHNYRLLIWSLLCFNSWLKHFSISKY
ncbi:MAG: asparagine synthase (glutamine-hydrolyzing) [Planctomycetota bacterium]|jgi:asparagine synthase (glutamine-hydrolysing)